VGGVRGLILILNVYKFYIQINKQNTLFLNGHHFCSKNVKVRRLPSFSPTQRSEFFQLFFLLCGQVQKITKLKEIMRLDFDVLMEMIIEINPHKVGIINHVLCGVFALFK
jgi:hypothetical protein